MNRKHLSAALICAAALLLGAADFPEFVSCKKPVKILYRPGEPMDFSCRLEQGGKPLTGMKLRYQRLGDDGKVEKGEAISDEKPLTFRTKMEKPGFVRFEVTAFGPDGKVLRDRRNMELKFMTGAGVQPDKLQPYPEPKDFDAFWTAQKKRLAAVPITAKTKLLRTEKGVEIYSVEIAGIPFPVRGYLTKPAGAKPKSLGAIVEYPSFGANSARIMLNEGKRQLALSINVHGIENGRENAYYRELNRGRLKSYLFCGREPVAPEKLYLNTIVLQALRGCQYLTTLPEWNGKELVAKGGSQGGFLAASVAALEHRVTDCRPWAPWGCDVGGEKLGRIKGWQSPMQSSLLYYDPVYHAKRIQCPVSFTVGVGEHICPPAGVALAYQAAKTKKSLLLLEDSTHIFHFRNAGREILRGGAVK